MCGIYGITEKNYNIVSDCIKIASHRGPDGLSIWMNDKITLGHNLLSITSAPSEGKQPWITDRQNILVYNGEIFNYYEIKKKFRVNLLQKLHVILNYSHGCWKTIAMKMLLTTFWIQCMLLFFITH